MRNKETPVGLTPARMKLLRDAQDKLAKINGYAPTRPQIVESGLRDLNDRLDGLLWPASVAVERIEGSTKRYCQLAIGAVLSEMNPGEKVSVDFQPDIGRCVIRMGDDENRPYVLNFPPLYQGEADSVLLDKIHGDNEHDSE